MPAYSDVCDEGGCSLTNVMLCLASRSSSLQIRLKVSIPTPIPEIAIYLGIIEEIHVETTFFLECIQGCGAHVSLSQENSPPE